MQHVIAAVLPWPTRQERKARIRTAKEGAAQAEEKAEEARSLTQELRELRRENHVSDALDQLISRRARQQTRSDSDPG